MSKTDLAGRMTRVLISICVVLAGMELSVMQALAGGMPGLFSNESSCCNSTCQSSAVSECNCPHCREARCSDSRLVRFFKSHTTKTKWAERPPKQSWKCYHPCAPYFQPSFGIYQTSWSILPHDECSVPFAVPPGYSDDLSPSDTEMHPLIPPILPEASNEAIRDPAISTAVEIAASDSDNEADEKVVFHARKSSKKPERQRPAVRLETVSESRALRQHPNQNELPPPAQAIKHTKPESRYEVAAHLSPKAIALPTGLKFEERTPDSIFTSEDRSFFQTQPAAATRAVRRLK